MNCRRLASAVAAAIVVAGIGVSITAASPAAHQRTTAATSPTARPAAPAKVIVNCEGRKQVEPRQFVLACADGNAYLDKLAWTSWTPAMGTAAGVFIVNDCNPFCAAGHFHSYQVLAVVWGSSRYHGSQRYSELTIIFTGKRPQGLPQTMTQPLWAPEL